MSDRQSAPDSPLDADIAAVRRFSRFYTSALGIVEPKLLGSPFSLPQARLIYELGQHDSRAARDLARDLGVDPGQVSRTLQDLARRGYVSRRPSKADARRIDIALTAKGRAAHAALDARSRAQIGELLRPLPPDRRRDLVRAMTAIERAIAPAPAAKAVLMLRTHRAGDIGWIVSRHGALYAQEFGWDIDFEALVAEIAAQFLRTHDAARERCWIAESGGERVGSVMLVRASDEVAKLRLLIVEPSARGQGVGRVLTEECMRFAREAGYRRMTLWTQSILLAARGIYRAAGFALVREEPHRSFGHDLIGETWERDL